MYDRAGVSVTAEPGALLFLGGWVAERPAPMRAPARTQRAISFFSAAVRMRVDWPRYFGESWPGIQGGIRPSCVITRMPLACALAVRAERSENGAIPPGVWQPAHFCAKIGATFDQVGAADERASGRLPLEPAAIAATATATAAAATSATAILLRCTPQRYRQREPLVKPS